MRTIALIPARGGSKGIPGKNLQFVGGRPLVVRSIEHALAARHIDGVYVSTDDTEVAAYARSAGARVIDRPADLCTDLATTESAVAHALGRLAADNITPEVVVLLQCTSPFRSPKQLDVALTQFRDLGCDSMLSVASFDGFVWKRDADGQARPATYAPGARPRRQEIDDVYVETGSFYIFRRAMFEATGCRLGGTIDVFEVPPHDTLDIDEPEDLSRACTQARQRGDALAEAAGVQWLVLDVDGTLTDGAMFYGEDGAEYKRFDTRDGAGLAQWRDAGGRVAWITGEYSRAVRRRAEKLHVDHLVLGCHDKSAALEKLMTTHGLRPADLLAMGDDLPDLAMRPHVGWFVAPPGARPEVIAAADAITASAAGHGAVREVIDALLAARAIASVNDERPPVHLVDVAA